MKCSKCGSLPKESDQLAWRCNSCKKVYRVSLKNIQGFAEKKQAGMTGSLLKCKECGASLDDGNETIAWKCSCGNVQKVKLEDYVDENITDKNSTVFNEEPNLVICPRCGKKISDQVDICPNCGCLIRAISSIKKSTQKDNIVRPRKRIIILVIIGIVAIFTLLFFAKSFIKCEHKYDNGVIEKEATCTEEGQKTFTCSLCGETKIESIPVKPHIYDEEITKESSFDEEGEKTFTCKNCKDSYIEYIPVRDDDVVVTVTDKSNIPKDTDSGRYSDRIEFTFEVMNRTDKIIKGVQGKLKVCDLHGEEILTMNCDFTEESIPPNESITVNELGMDVNQFVDGQTKFYNMDFSDLKFEYEVTDIVYDDGLGMKEQPSSESIEIQKVTVNVTDKQNLDVDYNAGRYYPRVEFLFDVYNNTSKDMKGVQGKLTIKDMFGEDIILVGLDFTGKTINANSSVIFSGIGIDINQFMDDQVKVYNTDFDDLKFEYEVTAIVYSDGTTE